MSAKGDHEITPKHFSWYRGSVPKRVTFFTDSCLRKAPETEAEIKVAWLLEPPPFRTNTYEYVEANPDQFDLILTYAAALVRQGHPFHFYPYGGTMIAPTDRGLKLKTKNVSMVVSEKTEATGHKLRHQIAAELSGAGLFDLMGSGYGPYVPKYNGLADYRYSIIVEGERLNWCFDEKLLDAIMLGTVPIFWGCPAIADFFNADGIISFEDRAELPAILEAATIEDYESRREAMKENYILAHRFVCAEDWIYNAYFGGLEQNSSVY
jgi:hypothetical protein